MCECGKKEKGLFPGDAAKADQEKNTKNPSTLDELLSELVNGLESDMFPSEVHVVHMGVGSELNGGMAEAMENIMKQVGEENKEEKKVKSPLAWKDKEYPKDCRISNLANAFTGFMTMMGLNMKDASLKDTPRRVAKMFVNETCRGLYDQPPKITTFPNDNKYGGMVVVKDIKVQSLCEHHFQPFVGTCDIAYLPKNKVAGLSKFARVVDYFSRRPQVQERLTQNIFDHLKKVLDTDNLIIRIDAEHFCMKLRGVEDACSSTATCIASGLFGIHSDGLARQEFFDHLKLSKK